MNDWHAELYNNILTSTGITSFKQILLYSNVRRIFKIIQDNTLHYDTGMQFSGDRVQHTTRSTLNNITTVTVQEDI